MLKIVYPVCCGVDVHKRFIVATIATTNDENITSYMTKRFDTFTEDLNSFKVLRNYFDKDRMQEIMDAENREMDRQKQILKEI